MAPARNYPHNPADSPDGRRHCHRCSHVLTNARQSDGRPNPGTEPIVHLPAGGPIRNAGLTIPRPPGHVVPDRHLRTSMTPRPGGVSPRVALPGATSRRWTRHGDGRGRTANPVGPRRRPGANPGNGATTAASTRRGRPAPVASSRMNPGAGIHPAIRTRPMRPRAARPPALIIRSPECATANPARPTQTTSTATGTGPAARPSGPRPTNLAG